MSWAAWGAALLPGRALEVSVGTPCFPSTGTVHTRGRVSASVGFSAMGSAGKSGNVQPKLPLCWILMSGLWKQCLVNLQRPPVGCPCAQGCADKAVICPGGLGLGFSSPEGTGAGSPYSSCTLPSAPGIRQGMLCRAGNSDHTMAQK